MTEEQKDEVVGNGGGECNGSIRTMVCTHDMHEGRPALKHESDFPGGV
jgi:hypothetical protein